jgi:hypothetical protein
MLNAMSLWSSFVNWLGGSTQLDPAAALHYFTTYAAHVLKGMM